MYELISNCMNKQSKGILFLVLVKNVPTQNHPGCLFTQISDLSSNFYDPGMYVAVSANS